MHEEVLHSVTAKKRNEGIGFKEAELFLQPLKFIRFMALKVKAVERLLKFDKESASCMRVL